METEMARLEIRKGAEGIVEVGGLRFVACRREIGDFDGGVSLNVWSELGDEDRELLRFDFFRKRPHYHSPADNQSETRIDTAQHVDGLDWGIEALTQRGRELVREAGYGSVADAVDAEALRSAAGALRSLCDGLAEPTEVSYFDLPAKALAKLATSVE